MWLSNNRCGHRRKLYQAKLDHVAKQIAAKPELAQISTAYGKRQQGREVDSPDTALRLADSNLVPFVLNP
jgi:hypothetical protein